MYKKLPVVPIVAYLTIVGLIFIVKPIHASEALSFDEYTAQSKALPYDEFVNGGDAQLYRNDEHHFRINFPAGWEVVDGDGEHVVKKAVKDGCTVLVLVKDLEEFLSEEEKKTLSNEDRDDIRRAELNDFSDNDTKDFLDGVASSETEYFPGSTVLEKGIRYIDNRKAVYIRMNQVYKVQDRQTEGVSTNYFTLHGGKFYQVSGFYSTKPIDENKHSPIINASLSTFVFEDWDSPASLPETKNTSEAIKAISAESYYDLVSEKKWGTLAFFVAISILFTWGLGLLVPILLRFVLLKRPLSKWASLLVVITIFVIQALASRVIANNSKSGISMSLYLVAYVGYLTLRKGIKDSGQGYCKECGSKINTPNVVCSNCKKNKE